MWLHVLFSRIHELCFYSDTFHISLFWLEYSISSVFLYTSINYVFLYLYNQFYDSCCAFPIFLYLIFSIVTYMHIPLRIFAIVLLIYVSYYFIHITLYITCSGSLRNYIKEKMIFTWEIFLKYIYMYTEFFT